MSTMSVSIYINFIFILQHLSFFFFLLFFFFFVFVFEMYKWKHIFSLIWRSQTIFEQKVLTSCSLYYIQKLIKDLYELRQTNVCECCCLSGWMWAAQSSSLSNTLSVWWNIYWHVSRNMTALTCSQRPSGSDWSCFCVQVPSRPDRAETLYLQTVWSRNGSKWLPDLFRSITFSLRSTMLINAELFRLSHGVCGSAMGVGK